MRKKEWVQWAKVPALELVEQKRKELLVMVHTAAAPSPAGLHQMNNGQQKIREYKQFCPSFLSTSSFHKLNFNSAHILVFVMG